MIREDLSARHGELFPVLLQTFVHCEIALIQYRTAVSLDVAGASTLLLFGSTVLRHGGSGEEKRQGADNKRNQARVDTQSLSVESLRLLLRPGTAVDGGVRNASKRSFTIA